MSNHKCIACFGPTREEKAGDGIEIYWCLNENAWGWECICGNTFHTYHPRPFSGETTECPNPWCKSTSLKQIGPLSQ